MLIFPLHFPSFCRFNILVVFFLDTLKHLFKAIYLNCLKGLFYKEIVFGFFLYIYISLDGELVIFRLHVVGSTAGGLLSAPWTGGISSLSILGGVHSLLWTYKSFSNVRDLLITESLVCNILLRIEHRSFDL